MAGALSRLAALALAACAMAAGPGTAAGGRLNLLDVPGGAAEVAVADDGRVLVTGRQGATHAVTMDGGTPGLSPAPPAVPPPPAPADALPDGRPGIGHGTIRQAWLVGPTGRYRHAVLGDAVEASGLRVVLDDGRTLDMTLPADSVFEDLEPRIVDADGDGTDEVLAVRSRMNSGAALAILAVRDGRLAIVAETPAIGIPNRWLNPVGVADLDGDGAPDIALVRTPHIGGVLEIHRYRDGAVTPLGERGRFSTHAIGARVLAQAALADLDGDGVTDLLLPTQDRRRVEAVSVAGGRFRTLFVEALPASPATAFATVPGHAPAAVVFGLEDGRLAVVTGTAR